MATVCLGHPPRADALLPHSSRGLGDTFLRLHVLALVGYAVAGKGFAYLGFGPVFVGELLLASGLVVAVLTRATLRIPRSSTTAWLLLFVGWCAIRAVPDWLQYGSATLRDSVIWGYALFALILSGLLVSRPRRLVWLIRCYRRFCRVFVFLLPAVAAACLFYLDALPRVPGTKIAVLELKSGDVLTHLAGIACFQLVGLTGTSPWSLLVQWIAFAVMSILSRGGMLAFLIPVGLVVAVRPLRRRFWLGLGVMVLMAPLLLTSDVTVTFKGREISGSQLVRNALSIVGADTSGTLANTRTWRLEWWSWIVDYTVFGRYFWTGKGFGLNLAHSDGFDVDSERSLRSPHNGHLTVLARVGVPGAALWIVLQWSWASRMARAYRRSRRAGQRVWPALFLFLIAYWLAHMVNASFDVYLEGPMGGIWFWSLFGVGLAADWIQRRGSALLDPVHGAASPAAAATQAWSNPSRDGLATAG